MSDEQAVERRRLAARRAVWSTAELVACGAEIGLRLLGVAFFVLIVGAAAYGALWLVWLALSAVRNLGAF